MNSIPLRKPAKTIYFEKRGKGIILNCRVEVERDPAHVLDETEVAHVFGDEVGIDRCFCAGKFSEMAAIKYVKRQGYVEAMDWELPPPTDAL